MRILNKTIVNIIILDYNENVCENPKSKKELKNGTRATKNFSHHHCF